jgi:hypothetical protein
MFVESDRNVEALAATPAELRELLARAEARPRAPEAGQWSALEVLRHLLASDAILSPRVMQILVRPGAPLAAFDERAWAELAARAGLTPAQELDLFAARRAALVGLLRTLTPAEWAHEGEHEVAGRLSVARIVAHLAEHEREHLAQLGELAEGAS